MKKELLCIVFLLLGFMAKAIELDVEYNPRYPRAGESFQISFVLSGSDLDSFKDLKFDSEGMEILNKDSRTSSSKTTYINGKLTRHVSETISYDVFAADEARKVIIKDLVLVTTDQELKYSDITIPLRQARHNKDFFAKAEIENTSLYKGEGSLVSYYLYSKNPIDSVEIKKFPTLKGFLKRFRQKNFYTEKINHNGEIFNRTYLYSSYIFPQRSGDLVVDPITVSARVATESGNRSVFDAFGFTFSGGLSRSRKVVRSKPLKLKIKSLPAPIPKDFSGLVGKHQIQFSLNKERFLANEPVEVKLTITGVGELEAFEAPEIFDEKNFEKFDTSGKLSMTQGMEGRKEFSYTYLAKVSGHYPARKIGFSIFNPMKKKYQQYFIKIPALKVAGGSMVADKGRVIQAGEGGQKIGSTSLGGEAKGINEGSSDFELSGLYAPYFSYEKGIFYWPKYLMFICLFIFLASSLIFLRKIKWKKSLTEVEKSSIKLKKGSWAYKDFYYFLSFLNIDHNNEKSITKIIEDSSLSNIGKKYFLQILTDLGAREFSEKNFKKNIKLKPKYISEVIRIVNQSQRS